MTIANVAVLLTSASTAQTITDTANNFQTTTKTVVLAGIAIVTFALVVMTGLRARSWIPAFGALLVGAAMYWAVTNWDTAVKENVENQLDQDAGGGGRGGGAGSGPNVGG